MPDPRDLPLFAWGDALRARRRHRIKMRRRAAMLAIIIAGLGATLAYPPRPRLVWNASASAPLGLYRVEPGATLARGDMVIAWPPPEARKLAARRHYLPANVPLVKRVAAVGGDRICARGATITINEKAVTARRAADAAGRPLPWWHGCTRLRPSALFLLMVETPDSFDGRYFGPTKPSEVIGKATLLWARP